MTESRPEALESELDAIAASIDMAAAAVAAGKRVDLSPLGVRVERLCAGLTDLPTDDARRLGARLPKIVGTLDQMARLLAANQAASPADSPVSHQRASLAYGARQPGRRGGG